MITNPRICLSSNEKGVFFIRVVFHWVVVWGGGGTPSTPTPGAVTIQGDSYLATLCHFISSLAKVFFFDDIFTVFALL